MRAAVMYSYRSVLPVYRGRSSDVESLSSATNKHIDRIAITFKRI